jgi:hypothetical protein
VTSHGTRPDGPRLTQVHEECEALARFQECSGLLAGTVSRGANPPDFIIEDDNQRIAVEMTRYHQQSGRKGSPLAEDEALEDRAISAARVQFELAYPNVHVSVQPFFRAGSLSPKNVLAVADRLSRLVPKVMPSEPTEIDRMTDRRATWEELEKAGLDDALVSLFVTRLLARHAVMQGNDWGGSAGRMSTDTAHVESVIREKELDLPRYLHDADAFWLVIYAPAGRPSGFFDLEVLKPAMWHSTFDRVVFLDVLWGRYVLIV